MRSDIGKKMAVLYRNLGGRTIHCISHSRCSAALLVPLIALTAVVLIPPAPAQAANCYFYQVSLTGTAAWVGIQSASFQNVRQFAMWRDAGIRSTHRVEFSLFPFQDLNISAQVGQIELATNSFYAFFASLGTRQAAQDLATVSVASNGVVSFQLTTQPYPPANVFVAPGNPNAALGGLGFAPGLSPLLGLGGQILSTIFIAPQSGTGYFYLPDSRTIAGALNNLSGISASDFNPNVQGRYQATFNGSFYTSQQC